MIAEAAPSKQPLDICSMPGSMLVSVVLSNGADLISPSGSSVRERKTSWKAQDGAMFY